MKHVLGFSTSHHQFYIKDKEAPISTAEDSFWTKEAQYFRLAMGMEFWVSG